MLFKNDASRSLSENRKPTAKNRFWPAFPIIFVKYAQYSPQIMKKSGSKQLPLATVPVLGQAPRQQIQFYKAQ